ncbi:hypothetical protein N9O53_03820 [Candidatus Pelagibacter ubique]|jgi:hypothetical protein|nr:hypothetical protein [Candidatus Pelagibacter ubique]MDC0557970.1 hypothetical protein [Candidatus Pelagibacter ubique]|tara:strand:+ start:213 stop:554 length:342 start_codon:yes stop_codon:yes gene_type:complete
MVSKVDKELIRNKEIIENQIKKYFDIINEYKTKINSNKKKLAKINEELIDKEDYIYLNYKDAIKEKLYDSSITFERYKELYLLALKRKTKANNYQRKSSLRSDIDVKKKKSLW